MPSALLLQQNRSLKELSTFGIGGPALFFVEVKSIQEMQEAIQKSRELELPYLILGKGSNCLFDDRGFRGLIIHNKIDFLTKNELGNFHVGAGYSFSLLGVQTARQGWSGLEFASGIPGSVGGAVFMNAGANGRETSECLTFVDFVNHQGQLQRLAKEDLKFSYRTSLFHHIQGAIVGATFSLAPSPEARSKQIEIVNYRKKTQPYGAKSAGCVFRNPQCHFAGKLIEESDLKGALVGGAKVSEVHANFIVNTGTASSKEILELIQIIKHRVKERSGQDLESEIRFIPYEGDLL